MTATTCSPRILRGEIPAHKVFEERAHARLHGRDAAGRRPRAGDPKAEAENLFDLPGPALAATILTTQRVARRGARRPSQRPGS